ncbi:Uncharacterized RNA pseudouridine synthase Cpar_0723 [Chlamydiales bacterium SCGC AG-110-P3]|nr:Uncharacterized RNA pseudouridine synthase Cpar_0723 [Chlamydiales bacterium SCGC AG-110-P3]
MSLLLLINLQSLSNYMADPEINTFVVSDSEAGSRLDKLLSQRYQGQQSRSYFQKLIRNELVLLNGRPVKKQVRPESGDEVEVEFALTPEVNLHPENLPLEVLYEDDHLIIINKSAGMVVHPAPGNWTGTFVNALLYHCGDSFQAEASLRPGIVHRLDKNTSGCLVAAKNLHVQQRLVELFSLRKIYKEYIAVCVGNPGDGTVDVPIGRHPVHRKQMAVIESGGRHAVTHYSTLAHKDRLSVVKLVLETGRTHQIRVHLRHRGMPILGDCVYGTEAMNRQYSASRQMLHAYRLRFMHPITGEKLDVMAPIPVDMRLQIARVSDLLSL